MRLTHFLLGTVFASACAVSAQAGHFHGWYVGLEGGANWIADTDTDFDIFMPPVTPTQIEFDTGWAALGTVGYAFRDSNWRLEGEFGYRQNKIDSIAGSGTSDGQFDQMTAMANLLYDIPLTERLSANVGAGVGGVHEQFDDGTIDQDEDWGLAYQGIAGLSYAIGSRTDLTLNYRYLVTDESDFEGAHLAHRDYYSTDDFHNQTVTVGLRFDLSPDEARMVEAPAAPSPAAAPPPPPSAAPKQFLIFFGFNKTNLTAEAQSVVQQAAAAAREYGSASISIVGHADTVGSQGYNQKLSERRANVVRQALVAQGIESSKITASGRGETELMVQTGDNVKEPQNRRASIDLQ